MINAEEVLRRGLVGKGAQAFGQAIQKLTRSIPFPLVGSLGGIRIRFTASCQGVLHRFVEKGIRRHLIKVGAADGTILWFCVLMMFSMPGGHLRVELPAGRFLLVPQPFGYDLRALDHVLDERLRGRAVFIGNCAQFLYDGNGRQCGKGRRLEHIGRVTELLQQGVDLIIGCELQGGPQDCLGRAFQRLFLLFQELSCIGNRLLAGVFFFVLILLVRRNEVRGLAKVRLCRPDVVAAPVLREIDYLKNKGNDRVANRARAASAAFRKMLADGQKVVCESDPRVVLSVESQHQYSKDLEDRLNYQERDDQLIGTVHEFAWQNQGADVRLLTHDTVPLYTAQGLGLTVDMIPDDWLLPPEKMQTEKELAALKDENARLKKAEPSFAIRCVDGTDTEVERYEGSYIWYEALTDAEVGELMDRLKERFPLETDFGPKEPEERDAPQTGGIRIPGMKQVFTPATDDEIAKYRDEAYPQWLERCEEVLRDHHRTLRQEEPVLEFMFLAENRGTRPATDALVTIEARGNFQIKPPPYKNRDDQQVDEVDDSDKHQASGLPRPPAAPCGQRRTSIGGRSHDHPLHALDVLNRSLRGVPGMMDYGSSVLDPARFRAPIIQPKARDPNSFFYKPDRPMMPQDAFSIECDQWRHENGEEPFVGEIHVPTDQDQVDGALVCRIQAGNLSKPESKLIPLRIAIQHASRL